MAIETFGTIQQLNVTQPTNTDLLSEGDDHIRGIKATLKDTFPLFDRAIDMAAGKFNYLNGAFDAGSGKNLTFLGDVKVNANISTTRVTVSDTSPNSGNDLICKSWADTTYASKPAVADAIAGVGVLVFGANKLPKVRATGTGVDVTGTAVVDGLTVQGAGSTSGTFDVGTKLTVGNAVKVTKGNLDVIAGGVTATRLTSTGAISFSSTCTRSSDERLKANIEPLDKGTEGIEPVKYQKGGNFEYGVIAQQVQPIIPHAVIEEAGGYLGVDYNNLIPMLIWDIKQLREEIKALKGE